MMLTTIQEAREKFMKIQNKILIAIALSVCSQPVLSVPFTFEGRSLGMGGVSTATADLATAAWANPAMLTNQRPDDDFSLLIGVGAFARDNENLRDDIDAFQAADSRRKNTADPVEQAQALQEMADIVSGIGNKDVAGDVSGVLAVGMAFREYAMALSIRADAVGAGTVEDLSTAPADLIDPNSGANMLTLEGVIATEFGFSIAKRFDLSGSSLSVGLKPKAVDLQSYIFRESINTVDSGENVLDQGLKSDLGTFASLDMGVAYDFDRSFRLGLNVRNIVTDEFQLPNGQILNFETTARIGAAYFNRFLTVAVDYDVTENKPLLANPGFDDLKTQYLSVGAEFNAFDFAQLRVGARKNLAGGITESAKDTALTAGIGFWLGFNLDVAATFADNTVGGFVQTGFRF